MSKGKRGKKRFPKPSQASPSVPQELLPDEPEAVPEPELVSPAQPTSFFRRCDWLAFTLATLISFGVYFYTLAPDLTLEDSGELAVGSMYAGVPHPPGYPVWTLYTWAFTQLPFGNIAWRVALSSAVAAALACGLLALMVSRTAQLMLKSIETFREVKERQRDLIGLASGTAAGLLLAFNGFMWSQAVIVEVYTLGIFTFMAVLALMMRWYFRPTQRWPLYLAYFCFGLCFANHQTLLLAAVGIEAIVLLADRKIGKDFLLCNCGVYILGLFATLPAEGAPPDSEPGVFILFNTVGVTMFALLLGMMLYDRGKQYVLKGSLNPTNLTAITVSAVAVYLLSAGAFGWAWGSFFDDNKFSSAANAVKVWALLNALLLGALALFSWLKNGGNPNTPPLLRHWMPLLNTRAAWLLGAAFYLYMPIASMTNPPMNWAYPRTEQGFKHSFFRKQYDKIEPSNLTRIFFDRNYIAPRPNNPSPRTQFNGGQAYVYLEEAAQEFSMSYLALAFLPMAFLPWMAIRERRWIAALTGIFISFTLILIFLLNPTADEQNRHLYKVFFTATHIFIALAAGLGTALVAATLTSRNRELAIGLTGFLSLLVILEIIQAVDTFKATDFIIPQSAAVIGLSLIFLLLLCAVGRLAGPKSFRSSLLALGVGLIILLPIRPALSNWAVNEQRGHLFGYWYGHDMFTPPFKIFPEMDKDAILFGGTDPGRFAPTYMIFCESFIAAKYKRDKNFDRRDVYIITQNALADGTYLQYIRAHYNRSAQVDKEDKDFFRSLADKLDPDEAKTADDRRDVLERRSTLYMLTLLGLLVGAGMLVHASILRRDEENHRESLGAFRWGGLVILGSLLMLPAAAKSVLHKADGILTGVGQRVEQARRDRGVYPKNEIHTPSTLDNQIAFNDYLQDAMRRMALGQLAHNENVTLNFPFQCPKCGTGHLVSVDRNRLELYRQMTVQGGLLCPNDQQFMPTPSSPQMQVRGTGSVMAINALLTKVIFETNPAHSFYVEESYPLQWMYPYITPHGIIMKLEAEREFEITAITPAPLNPTNAPVQLAVGDELTLPPGPDQDSIKPLTPAKFFVSSIQTNGMPSAIRIEDGGRFELSPPELLFVTGERTNVASLKVKMERIPNAAAYQIIQAEVDPKMAGFNFQKNEVLQVFDSIISGSLQIKQHARLRVTEVNSQTGIAQVEIIQGGRYVLMPPRHINLHAANGVPLRMEIQPRRIPKYTELSEAMLARDRKFWDEYSKRLIGDAINETMTVEAICQWVEKTHLRRNLDGFNGDPRFLRDQLAQKGFSKLRGSIGNIYAWRMRLSPVGSKLRARYAREAEYAYRQAFAFGPISPEAVIRYTALLGELGRHRDAVHVTLAFQKLDPHFPQTSQMIEQALEREIALHAAAHEMEKALESAEFLQQLVPNPRYKQLVESLKDAIKAKQIYLDRFNRDPGNVDHFNMAVDVTVQSRKLQLLPALIDRFKSNMIRNEPNLAALARAYNFTEDYSNKEKIYQEMATLIPNDPVPWYDLANVQMRLNKTNAAANSLLKSLTLYSASGTTNQYDIPSFTRTNAVLAPLRERPVIQKLLEPKED
ncbi:MAG: DUF2723 domain-containing protein [Verrucomicrobia subdivision 3 bacterium]|nr:DUF2723 domain-containing protein [Limisphaerales bacterium]